MSQAKQVKQVNQRNITRPIYQLTSGRKGYTILSHSVGPDWAAPENYIDEVREDYAPLFAAAPGLLAACKLAESVSIQNRLRLKFPEMADALRTAIAAATKTSPPAVKFAGAGIAKA